jgi:hypothetical protein
MNVGRPGAIGTLAGMDPGWTATQIAASGLPGARIFAARSDELPDWCTPLDHPRWVIASEASMMRDEDAVLGFEMAGRTWAIPWWVMKNHHVANLMLEDQPFLVTLCELCVAGGVFDPMIGGRRAWFQNNGWYRLGALMTDDLTGSLWSMAHARCVAGPLEGTTLLQRPIVHARWREWATMYPQTLVVDGEGEPRDRDDGHGKHAWAPDHFGARRAGMQTRGIDSAELVVSVELEKSDRAYLLADIHAQGGIVEDTVDGRPIVVVTLPGTWLCVVFTPEVAGTRVHLEWDRTDDPPIQLVDRNTGGRFDLWGRCVTDGQRDVHLPYVRSTLEKWHAWATAHPDGEASPAPAYAGDVS